MLAIFIQHPFFAAYILGIAILILFFASVNDKIAKHEYTSIAFFILFWFITMPLTILLDKKGTPPGAM